jgi:uncharacterized membrane protein
MTQTLTEDLRRWREAQLLDAAQAEAILAFEARRHEAPAHLKWPAVLAIAFGALMVGAGTLLFVAAHWDNLSPASRFTVVLVKVLAFHAAGAWFSGRMPRLAMALHGLGTLALGAGIFLAGQIFNLQEHWPGGVLLWALGAWLGVALLRDWVQGLLAALLTPFWLGGEWMEATRGGWQAMDGAGRIASVGALTLAVAYLTGRRGAADGPLRKALAWVGGLALIPAALAVVGNAQDHYWRHAFFMPRGLAALGWGVAMFGPLLVALALRRRSAWMNAAVAGWALVLAYLPDSEWRVYAWCALGAIGLVAWGLREERRERVNLGVAGFALVLLCFYFSSVMDKLGRSLGLMGLGLLFLVGGWQLERMRRALNARIEGGAR